MYYIACAGVALMLWLLSTTFYRSVNRGLSVSARHQQASRFAVASLMAVAPVIVAAGVSLCEPQTIFSAVVAAAWGVTYPLLYHLGHRKNSVDYDNYMDIAAGLYLAGALEAFALASLCAPYALGVALLAALSAAEAALLLCLLLQWGYMALYRQSIDLRGMTILLGTDINEAIEFARTYPRICTFAGIAAFLVLTAAPFVINIVPYTGAESPSWIIFAIEIAIGVGVTFFFVNGRRSPLSRCGLPALYGDVKEYKRCNADYTRKADERMATLRVMPDSVPLNTPSTVLMIIGESASRDFMSAFTPSDRDTTPWLRARLQDPESGFIAFPNSYASAMHTVETLQCALTEKSAFNDVPFFEAVSIVDVARKAGYRVHWYSNQGHLGAFDTPVSLIAECADVAKWTDEQVGKAPYDEALLDFFDELDPGANNFVILHLRGSHFNFLNRYPRSATVWGEPGVEDNVLNYCNSLRYTDGFMQQAFERLSRDFNLKTMLYFSDHATIPDRRRTVDFSGFGHVRIPVVAWLSEEFRESYPAVAEALEGNREKYFTNDLVFELMCTLLGVRPGRFDDADCLASPAYSHGLHDLRTMEGTISLADDPRL